MRSARMLSLTLCVLPLIAACDRPSDERTAAREGSEHVEVASAPTPTYAAGHFGLGRAPSANEVAAWNRDIGPEGLELPAGRGSAREGEAIYRVQCAACHGITGQGIEPVYPALVGRDPRGEEFDFSADPSVPRTIGNYWPHATTLYDYIRRAMPLFTPGSLSADETYAVTAYLLAANRVIPEDAVLDAASLRAIRMPARDRFVPDDRSPTRH